MILFARESHKIYMRLRVVNFRLIWFHLQMLICLYNLQSENDILLIWFISIKSLLCHFHLLRSGNLLKALLESTPPNIQQTKPRYTASLMIISLLLQIAHISLFDIGVTVSII